MIIAIRHGATAWNKGESDVEVLRGRADPPLSSAGIAVVQASASEICEYGIEEVRASPNFLRDTQTRAIVASICNVPEVDAPELDPYDAGDLSGKPLINVLPLLEMLIAIPFLSAPGGETYEDYAREFAAYWHGVYAEFGGDDSRAVVLVLHGNEFRLLPHLLTGEPVGSYAESAIDPGDFVVIH
jgi:broad specificity phosphatase PhoE